MHTEILPCEVEKNEHPLVKFATEITNKADQKLKSKAMQLMRTRLFGGKPKYSCSRQDFLKVWEAK